MSSKADFIKKALADFRQTPRGYEVQLRDFLARTIVDRLDELDWSQAELAERIGKPESFVSRVIHGYANCTLRSAGLILHALGLDPAIYDTTRYRLVPTDLTESEDYAKEVASEETEWSVQPREAEAGKAHFLHSSTSQWTWLDASTRTSHFLVRQRSGER